MRPRIKRLTLVLMLALSVLVSAEPISTAQEADGSATQLHYGVASWYSESDPAINLRTANGEIFDDSLDTCASWNFDFGTYLNVTNLVTGESVVCRVNDRGPAKRLGRLIDLTKAAFRKIAKTQLGLVQVAVYPVEQRERR